MKIKADDVLEDQEAIHRFEGQISKLSVFKSIIRFFMKTKQNEEMVPEHDFIDLMHALAERRPVHLPKDRAACKYLVEQLLSRGYTRSDIAKRLSLSRKTVYNLMKSPLPISNHTGFG
jgi:predicted transcriptional regulator YheO